MKSKKGFTLIELLIAVAIIGVLSSIVFLNAEVARKKARDSRRVGDVKNIQIALEASFQNSPSGSQLYPADLNQLVTEGFVPMLPVGPKGDSYHYNPASDRLSYCLGATLENPNAIANNDTVVCDSGDTNDNYKVSR